MMTFAELLKNRRAIRDFQEKEVPLDIIKEILQESCLAPSASNGQPCRFSIVNCKNTIKALSDESKENLLDDFAKNKTALNPGYVDMLKNKNFNVFYNAPCLIYVIGSTAVRFSGIGLRAGCKLYHVFGGIKRIRNLLDRIGFIYP